MAKKKPKIYPIGDNIVVSQVEAEETSAGGILLPDQSRERPREGVVVAVGKGRILPSGRLVEPQLKEGDKVVFGQYGGTEIKVDGESYLIMTEGEILAVS